MASRWRLLWVLVLVAGCGTRANPAATCDSSGKCIDPSSPFCDADGTITGDPGACVAFTCTPGAVNSCEGSDALICNASSTGFDKQACVNGCDNQAGCLSCLPNQTSCVGSTLSTCDAHGNVASSTACDLGCSADSTHCNVLVPSNGLQAALDAVPHPPDVDLENGVIDVFDKTFTPTGGSATPLALQDISAAPGGVALRVLVARKLTLNNVTIGGPFLSPSTLAFVATSDVSLLGTVDVHEANGASCDAGGAVQVTSASHKYSSGGGGGGFGTVGGRGGDVTTLAVGGIGGSTVGTPELVPLRGGCPGGAFGSTAFAHAGGAVQFSSWSRIDVKGILKADAPNPDSVGVGLGGGAGGGILLEAPSVTVTANGRVFARGAGGAAANGAVGLQRDDALSLPGGTCGASCGGNGGDGAAPGIAAKPGGAFSGTIGAKDDGAGGGGGGLGRIRVNTADGTFTPASGALVSGALTSGAAARK